MLLAICDTNWPLIDSFYCRDSVSVALREFVRHFPRSTSVNVFLCHGATDDPRYFTYLMTVKHKTLLRYANK